MPKGINYHSTLHSIPEGRRSHIYRCESLRSCKFYILISKTEKTQTTHHLYVLLVCGFVCKLSNGWESISIKYSPPVYVISIWPRKNWRFCYTCCEMQFLHNTSREPNLVFRVWCVLKPINCFQESNVVNLHLNFIIYKIREWAKSNEDRISGENSLTIEVIKKTRLRGSKSKYQNINCVDSYVFINNFDSVM